LTACFRAGQVACGPAERTDGEEPTMTKGVRVAAVGVALATSVVLLQGSLANASPGSSDDDGHQDDQDTVLEFDVEFSPLNITDLGDPGVGPADLIVFNDVLLVDGTQVGHEVGSCVVVDASGLSSCTAVITLDGEGTIAFALENSPPPRKVLAVTGGSGRYRSVEGDGVLVENGDGTETDGGTGTLTLNLDLDD
jgi:hypothetical protein